MAPPKRLFSVKAELVFAAVEYEFPSVLVLAAEDDFMADFVALKGLVKCTLRIGFFR